MLPRVVQLMTNKVAFTTLGAAVLALSFAARTQAASLLTNGSFENPLNGTTASLSDGNNFVPPQAWTVSGSATGPENDGLSNLAKGTATGNGSPTPQLNPYDGVVAFDGDGSDCVVYQDFTMPVTSLLNVQIAFGGRDSDSLTGSGSSWSIGTVTGGVFTPVVTSATYHPNPGTGSATGAANRPDWIFLNTTTTNIFNANTTYRFVINLGNPDHVDAVLLTPVPEPSTLAAAGLGAGLLGWIGLQRRRRN